MIKTNLGSEIDLLRETSNSLLSYKYERRSSEQWSKFYGCLDTLRDMDDAIFELLNVKRKPTRAECIGFLQILFSQQDAIHHLSKCVGITNWKPVSINELKVIRDLRNRITSHSAWSNQSKDGVSSTSMINWSDIREGGFKAVIYRDKDDENYPLYEDIDFVELTSKNVDNLLGQIGKVIEKMKQTEAKLHQHLCSLDWTFLDDNGDGYLLEKMWSPWKNENDRMWQAKSHVDSLLERFQKAQNFFADNEIHEFDKYGLNALIAGAKLLQKYLENASPNEEEKLQYFVVLRGWSKLWKEFNEEILELKRRIGVP